MNAESIRAIVALLVTAIVNVANVMGFALDWGTVFNVVLSVASVASVAWVWWKNQNLTAAAQEAQKFLDELKEGNDA